jgi:hypothetical protein
MPASRPPRVPQELLHLVRNRPQRAVTSLNVEVDTKALADYVHAYWEVVTGEPISQPDLVRLLLVAVATNPGVDVPPDFRERVLRVSADLVDMDK